MRRLRLSKGLPAVNVRLDDRGGKEMLKTTQQNVGRRMAVVYHREETPGAG